MSDVHGHVRNPLLLIGHGNGALPGNLHIKAPRGTPMANAYLSLLRKLGHDDVTSFGDSTDELLLDAAQANMAVGSAG